MSEECEKQIIFTHDCTLCWKKIETKKWSQKFCKFQLQFNNFLLFNIENLFIV